ncbi:MAG: hypothetical protein EBQ92_03115 [Proteobacteria bacterium]|nr:hypothetical protein [Pseudomonadota bacterium]
MEACFTVNICKPKGLLPSTEKVFLGRLCEEVASRYLETEKKWKVIGRNVRFNSGEIDLVARDPKTGARWVVEVRGRKAPSYETSGWISYAKIQRLKRLANLMAVQARASYRILFLQVEVFESKKSAGQFQVMLKEFEIQEGS